MTDWTLVVIAALAAVVLIVAAGAWRDVRVAKHTGTDPRAARDSARRPAAGGQEGQG